MEQAVCGDEIERFRNLLRCIVICHDVMMVSMEVDGVQTKQMSGSSVDEICLLEMVKERELARFIERNSKTIFIEILGEREQYDYVHINEFSSARKMMSVIVRNSDTQ